jgi:uncharacterized protein DUF1553/uncharacterized protein DUF1549/cytochrome c
MKTVAKPGVMECWSNGAIGILAASLFAAAAARAAEPTKQQLDFFESKVRPVLADKCYKCHSAELNKSKGGLTLDTAEATLKGGEDGPIIVPGDPAKSMLIKAISYADPDLAMPPQKEGGKLKDAEIAALTEWVKMGAPDPRSGPKKYATAGRSHWAFQPVKKAEVPQVKNTGWVANPIDAFVLAKLEAGSMQPSPSAERAALMRRAYFDIIGIPPTPEEVYAFINDKSPNAWEKVIDRLLASPQYGERWGRHWLDTARYSDTKGEVKKRKDDPYYPFAWTYRDWVIKAFNTDMPYDRFILEQLAADKLPEETSDKSHLAALGFLTVGQYFMGRKDDIIDDRIDVVGKGFLGLTVACARCHDHKFDPIPQADYYSLHGVFASCIEPKEFPIIAMPKDQGQYQDYLAKAAAIDEQMDKTEDKLKNMRKGGGKFAKAKPGGSPEAPAATPANPLAKKKQTKAIQKEILQDKIEMAKLDMTHPGAPARAMVLEDAPRPHDSPIYLRGEAQNKGDIVPRQFLAALTQGERKPFTDGSGRLELAKAIATKDNPLTARVMINRIWMHHFGAGFVPTPDDLGNMSDPPSHPELLDWLASYFTENGWSMKKVHKLILMSNTWQQSSANNPAYAQIDPANRLLWRANVRRLEFEALRDSILAIGDQLDWTMYGRPAKLEKEPYSTRRTVYGYIDRQNLADVLAHFDFANPDMTNSKRNETTVPTQSLFLMNNPMVVETAKKVVAQPRFTKLPTDAQRMNYLFWLIYQRPPSPQETQFALRFLFTTPRPESTAQKTAPAPALAQAGRPMKKGNKRKGMEETSAPSAAPRAPLTAWQELAHALLMTNEACYIN